MSLLDRFKKYINGDDEDYENDYSENDNYEEEYEEDNILIKMENNNSFNNGFADYNIKTEEIEKVELTEEEKINIIKNAIYKTIKYYDDFTLFETKCIESSREIGFEYINYFKYYIDHNLEITKEMKTIFKDEEQWNTAVLNTILIMIWGYREKSIEVFMEIYKEHKGLRLKAINLLIKLGSDVIERTDEIVDFISEDILNYNDEIILIILNKVSRIKGNEKTIALIQHFYKEYLKIGESKRAYEALVSLINAAEKYTSGHLRFLKSLALGNKTINLEKITRIDRDEEKYVTLKDVNDELKLDAAITYYNLSKDDKDINEMLNYLREYSLDLDLREKINLIFNN